MEERIGVNSPPSRRYVLGLALTPKGIRVMAKGQKRSNKEVRKPKQKKTKGKAATT